MALILAAGGCKPVAPPAPRVLLDLEFPVAELAVPKRLSITDPAPGYRLVEIDQSNVDVQLTQFVDGKRVAYDAPGRRATPERGCAFTRGGTVELIVASRDRVSASPQRVRVIVSAVDLSRLATDESSPAVECVEANAGEDHDDWAPAESETQAREYTTAGDRWATLGLPARAAAARLNAAWMVTRRLPQSDANLKRSIALGELARTGYRAAHDCVGASHATLQLAVPRDVAAGRLAKTGAEAATTAAAQFAQTRRDIEAAIACYEPAGARYFAAEAYNSLGSSYFYAGDYASALSQLAEIGGAIPRRGGARRCNARTVQRLHRAQQHGPVRLRRQGL